MSQIVHASLFSGIGGFDLAAEWMGWENAFHCEINEWCAKVLKYHFPNSKHYADITKTDFTKWRGKVDIITGGFPCQPFSTSGKRKGKGDDRYLWPQMLRVIAEVRPTWVIGENVGGITSMVQPGDEITVESQASLFEEDNKETILEEEYVTETIREDFERIGYTVQPILIPACSVGAPHRRDRVWFLAHSNSSTEGSPRTSRKVESIGGENINEQKSGEQQTKQHIGWCDVLRTSSNPTSAGREEYFANLHRGIPKVKQPMRIGSGEPIVISERHRAAFDSFPTQSPVCSRDDGVSFGLDGITFPKWRSESVKAYGNAIVPQVAYEIFKAIEEINNLSV